MAEKLTDIELSGIVLDETKPRVIGKDPSYNVLQEDDIETPFGNIHVAVQGDRSRPAIITYHDIGLNHITCFQGFFNFHDNQPILRHFCLYHVNAPGQQEGSSTLVLNDAHKDEQQKLLSEAQRRGSLTKGPEKKSKTGYPTMDQLAETILPVMQFYQIKRLIGFGVGAGANILTRFALAYPDKVDALFLIECTSTQAGWSEWFYQNVNTWYLRGGQLTSFTEEYLLWHWFGKDSKDRNYDLVSAYKENIKMINVQNLAMFIDSYMHRTDLAISRPNDTPKKGVTKHLKCSIMLITGAFSPHIDEVVGMNGRLDPQNSQWLKVSDCGGMPLEEQPAIVAEAFRLFLQGMGYVPTLSQTKIVADREIARRASLMDHSGTLTTVPNQPATVC